MSASQMLYRSLVAVALATFPAIAQAADVIPPIGVEEASVEERMASDWTVSIDPLYGWLPGMKGNMAFRGGPGVNIDVTAWDLITNLDALINAIDGIYEGSGEFRNGRFGIQYDLFYLNLGSSADVGSEVTGAIDIGLSITMATLAGNHRVYETPTTNFDLIAGARYTNVDLDLDVLVGPARQTISGGDSWVDPIVGVKGRHNIDDNWYIKGSALFGGFGASSDSLYDIAGFVGYEWKNGIEMYAGWRIADTDYEKGPFKWDMRLSGPMTGLTLKF